MMAWGTYSKNFGRTSTKNCFAGGRSLLGGNQGILARPAPAHLNSSHGGAALRIVSSLGLPSGDHGWHPVQTNDSSFLRKGGRNRRKQL
jgi:hypothetical protein